MAERLVGLFRGQGETLRWNLAANTLDGALFALGLSFVSQHTVLPVFVRNIGGGNVAVGLLPVLWILGFNVPQILVAGAVSPRMRRKPLLLRTAFIQRVPWLLLALASLLVLDRIETGAALLVFFLLYTMAAVGGSINLPVWFDLVVKLTPVNLRGRLFGARSILGALLGAGGGLVATYVLGHVTTPGGFAILFGLTFAAMLLSYLCLVALREETDSVPSRATGTPWSFSDVPRTVRQFHSFRQFLVADALMISGNLGAAFFAVHALERFALPDAYAGIFTAIMMGSSVVGGLVFGLLSDRYGHRLNLLVSSAATILACLLAIVAPGVGVYGLVFVCAAIALSVNVISRLAFLAELAPEEERPTMVATANLITSPFVLWGVAGGWLADVAGFDVVFFLGCMFSTAALVWILRRVPEPRLSDGHAEVSR